ncbi:hypothetical protein MAR_014050 [Mya arenaria]|uniref:Uncharacterized protein n=1 Tax=Mya arenaria TaxID=6604 RepID=A0ABY7GAV7_MYAAR|nr:hypothetical protein MAR_014050 [Mya arenaria]
MDRRQSEGKEYKRREDSRSHGRSGESSWLRKSERGIAESFSCRAHYDVPRTPCDSAEGVPPRGSPPIDELPSPNLRRKRKH